VNAPGNLVVGVAADDTQAFYGHIHTGSSSSLGATVNGFVEDVTIDLTTKVRTKKLEIYSNNLLFIIFFLEAYRWNGKWRTAFLGHAAPSESYRHSEHERSHAGLTESSYR
jgi:hypothetical protein